MITPQSPSPSAKTSWEMEMEMEMDMDPTKRVQEAHLAIFTFLDVE